MPCTKPSQKDAVIKLQVELALMLAARRVRNARGIKTGHHAAILDMCQCIERCLLSGDALIE